MRTLVLGWMALVAGVLLPTSLPAADGLRIAVFQADVTPPLGAPLCAGLVAPAREIVDPLSARGVVLLTGDQPIVLCAVDWVGIGNGGFDAFREALAKAAGTVPGRVRVHCLHQHDAPLADLSAEQLLAGHGLGGKLFDVAAFRTALQRTADAVSESLPQARPVTHLGIGKGKVEGVASNRRLLGPDGKVQFVRLSSCKDEQVRALPEGTIDPFVQLLTFWDGDRAIAALSYYATHPQSYYGQGGVSADFVGMARSQREAALPGVACVHFDGAGGNVAAGKYNDGSRETRPVLAARLAAGMEQAWNQTKKVPLRAEEIGWRVVPVALPPAAHLSEATLNGILSDEKFDLRRRLTASRNLAWLQRCKAGRTIELNCLLLGPAAVVHMPGELFVEYQLAAQALRPGSTVCMAAYGDYGPGYIGVEGAYAQGGYETGPVSLVAPEVERVLMPALKELLK